MYLHFDLLNNEMELVLDSLIDKFKDIPTVTYIVSTQLALLYCPANCGGIGPLVWGSERERGKQTPRVFLDF